MGTKVLLKPFKKLEDDTRLAESLAKESNCSGIGNDVHHSQSDKFLK